MESTTGDTRRHRMPVHRQQIRETAIARLSADTLETVPKTSSPTLQYIFRSYKTITEKNREAKEELFILSCKPDLNALQL